jgi:hypothetical protein
VRPRWRPHDVTRRSAEEQSSTTDLPSGKLSRRQAGPSGKLSRRQAGSDGRPVQTASLRFYPHSVRQAQPSGPGPLQTFPAQPRQPSADALLRCGRTQGSAQPHTPKSLHPAAPR